MSSIQESSINVQRQTITKNHPGYIGRVEIKIAHISVSNYASITFNYGDGSQDVIKFAGKDKLTFFNKRNKKKNFPYYGAGGKTLSCRNHHPEWNKGIIIKKTRIAHKLPKLPANSAAPTGYKPITGSGPCMCRAPHIGLHACGDLCCAASPWTATDPNATGMKIYDRNHFYKNGQIRSKLGFPNNTDGTLCFETWQNGWSFSSSPGLASVTISNDPSEQFWGLLDVQITWHAKNLKENIAKEKEMLARLQQLQADINKKKNVIGLKTKAVSFWDTKITARKEKINELQETNKTLAQQRETHRTAITNALNNLTKTNATLKTQKELKNKIEKQAKDLKEKADKDKKKANDDLQSMKQELTTATTQRNNMVKERDDAITARNGASQKINNLNKTIGKRNETIAGLDAQILGLNATKGQLAAQKVEKDRELGQILASIQTKNDILQGIVDHPDMAQIKSDIGRLERQYKTKSGQLQTLQGDIEKAETDEQEVRDDLEKAQEDLRKEGLLLESKRGEYITLDSEFIRLEASVNTLNTSIGNKEITLSELEGDIEQAGKTKSGLEGEIEEAGKIKLGLEGDIQDLGVDKEELEGDIEDLGVDKEELEGDIEDLGVDKEELEGDIEDLGVDKEELEGDIEQVDRNKQELEGTIDQLQKTLTTRRSDLSSINGRIESAELEEKSSQQELEKIGKEVLAAKEMLKGKQVEHQNMMDKLNDPSLSSEEIETIKERVDHAKDDEDFAAEVLLEALEEENKQSSGVIVKIDNLEEKHKERAAILRGNTTKLKQQIDSLRESLKKRNIQFESPLQALKDVETAKINLETAQLDLEIVQEQRSRDQRAPIGPQFTQKKQEVEEAKLNLKFVSSKVPAITLNETDLKTIKLLAVAEAEYDHQMKINKLLIGNIEDSLLPTFLKWVAFLFAAVIFIIILIIIKSRF